MVRAAGYAPHPPPGYAGAAVVTPPAWVASTEPAISSAPPR